jgi:hypothetical protein
MSLKKSRVATVLLVGVCLSAIFAGPKTEPSTVLDELLKQYRSLGLPLPPKDAKLVRYEYAFGMTFVTVDPSGNKTVRKPSRRWFTLALLVGQAKNQRSRLLQGLSEEETWEPTKVAPEPEAVEPFIDPDAHLGRELTPYPGNTIDFEKPPVDPFVLAIQCRSLGWTRLAKYLLETSQKDAKLALRDRLNHLAWNHWKRTAFRPGSDRALAAKRLRKLLEQCSDFDTEENREFVRCLELAAAPSKAKPGSIEGLVDDLVNYDEKWSYEPRAATPRDELDPQDCYWAIVGRGFAAVPTLIDHLDDDRLTQAMVSERKRTTVITTVGFRVRDAALLILKGLAGPSALQSTEWPPRADARTKAEALAWWQQARKVPEEQYLLDHVYFGKQHPSEPFTHIVPDMLFVMSVKYPNDLPRIYRRVLDDEPADAEWLLPRLVSRSTLRREEKVGILSVAARHKNPDHYLDALRALQKLDQVRFSELLLRQIQAFPTEGPFSPGPESHLLQLARQCDDPRVWEAVRDLAKRAPVGLRIEVLYWMGGKEEHRHLPEKPEFHLREKLELLRPFLDDATLRQWESNADSGPFAASHYSRIEVRDFAALALGELLGIDIPENTRRTKEEWARTRTQVKAVMEAELSRRR